MFDSRRATGRGNTPDSFLTSTEGRVPASYIGCPPLTHPIASWRHTLLPLPSALLACVLLYVSKIVQPVAEPFTLSISASTPQVRLGEEVYVRATLINTSDEPTDCCSACVAGADRKYQYDVRDAGHESTRKNEIKPNDYSGGLQMCELAPGKSITEETRVSWQHSFSRPGVYTVQLSRGYMDGGKEKTVKSNVLQITILPRL